MHGLVWRLLKQAACAYHIQIDCQECYEFANICIVCTNICTLYGGKKLFRDEQQLKQYFVDFTKFTLSAFCNHPFGCSHTFRGPRNMNLLRYRLSKTCLFWSNSNQATSKNCGSMLSSQIVSINYISVLSAPISTSVPSACSHEEQRYQSAT